MPAIVEKGKWNIAEAIIGVPGTGKSEFAVKRLMELARTPAYTIAHDVGWRLPDKLHDGTPTGIIRHPDIESVRKAIATKPRGIHAVSCMEADDVILFGTTLGAANLEKNGGAKGIPVVLYFDEIVGVAGASPYRLGASLRQLLAVRRHVHCGAIYTTQSPQLMHYQLLALATRITAFRLIDESALDRMRKLGIGNVDAIRTLPNYHSLSVSLS